MKGLFRNVSRCLGVKATCLAAVAIATGVFVLPDQSQAQTQISYAIEPLIVRNDRGGLLRKRLIQLRELRKQNRPVEIRGAVCFSTCTLFLGLPDTCVSPRTTFGFHGPSSYGRALESRTFNRASEVIASHYPSGLRKWYMDKARFRIHRVYRVSGAQIIKQGIRAC